MNKRLLRRAEAAEFLRQHGYPISKATLNKKATVGGGPSFTRWSRFPLYDPVDLLAWADSLRSKKVTSTSALSEPVDEQ